MTEVRRQLTDLPVTQLQYIFSPPGLPLPAKGESAQGSTSVLIRGGAGTGKTTFALAIAHAIAKAGSGLVLYLTTEFSPVEIAFKATLIGLREEAVEAFPGADGLQAGDVVVEHLSLVRKGNPVLTSAERKRSSINAVWTLLHPEDANARKAPLPVRSVVIDALTLPESGESEEALRAYVVEFVQALEGEGISVVLVEELAPGAAAWSAFVVDVVFELAFQPDPETQELRRKLTLSKCRHALSIPGPHDYGLDGGVPGVWPDLLRVITGSHGLGGWQPSVASPVRLLLPTRSQDKWAELHGGLVLSPQSAGDGPLRALQRTPGLESMDIHCGSITRISCADDDGATLFDNEGPHAIAWGILSVAASSGANTCIFHDLDGLLSRKGWSTPLLHVLESLRVAGFLLCVHSPDDALGALLPAANILWRRGTRKTVRYPNRRHRVLARYRLAEARLSTEPSLKLLRRVQSAQSDLTLRSARAALDAEVSQARGRENSTGDLMALELSGKRIDGSQLVSRIGAGDVGGEWAAWFALYTGDEWAAADAALSAVEFEALSPEMLLLWKAVCASLAGNQAAIDELKAFLGTVDESLVLDPLLRGLVATGQLEEAERVLAEVAERQALPSWSLKRMRVDMRLDSDDPPVIRDAAEQLKRLTADESPPLVHRAETWYNLGTAHERLGEHEAAKAAFTRASELNPFLDAAREGLTRLASPLKAS